MCNDKDGYKIFTFNTGKRKESLKVHRVVAQTFLKNPNEYKEINHIDGVKSNNYIENLEWCNRKQNVNHAINTGLVKTIDYPKIVCKKCNKIFQTTKDRKIFCSTKCSIEYKKFNSNKPEKLVLSELLITFKSLDIVGKMFGVTRTTIKRWCRSYNIPSSAKYYKNLNKFPI